MAKAVIKVDNLPEIHVYSAPNRSTKLYKRTTRELRQKIDRFMCECDGQLAFTYCLEEQATVPCWP